MSKAGADRGGQLEQVLQQILESPESNLPEVLDRACTDHPELADDLRRRVDHLRSCGVLSTPPTWNRLGPGAHFGHYELIRPLGGGGMGLVFLARDRELDREVALKIVRPEYVATDRVRERFLLEAHALARVDHPALCTVHETGEQDGIPFLVMRYVEGRSLDDWLENTRRAQAQGGSSALGLPHRTTSTGGAASSRPTSSQRSSVVPVVELMEIVARGVHAAHDAGVVHRDIEPANIVIDDRGEPVLLDFGLARQVDSDRSLTRTGAPLGTPAYMAPEQVRADRSVDRRTDVYALGATLYECLTLRPPHAAAERESLYREILTENPPDPRRFNRHVPRDLSVVIAKALEKEAPRRYRTAAAFADDLLQILGRDPIQARPPSPWRRLRAWARRHPVAATLIVVLSLALAVIGRLYQGRTQVLREMQVVELVHRSALLQESQPVTSALLARAAWRMDGNVETRSRLSAALAELRQIREWPGTRVRQCEISPDGLWLAEVRAGEGVVLRGLADGKVRWQKHPGHDVVFLEWSPDSRQLATFGYGPDPLILWRFDDGHPKRPSTDLDLPRALPVAYRPLPLLAYVADGHQLAVGDSSGRVFVFDSDGTELCRWQAHDGPIHALCRRPGCDEFLTVGNDGRAVLWDLYGNPRELASHHAPLCAAAFSSDGRFAAVGSSDGCVGIHDLAQKLDPVDIEMLPRQILCLAFSPDTSHVLVSTGEPRVGIWNRRTGELRKDFDRIHSAVWASCFSDDGWLAIAGRRGTIWIYDEQLSFCFALNGPPDFTSTLQPCRGRRLVSGSWDGTVRMWQLDVPEFPVLRGHDTVVKSARWSRDGGSIVSAGVDGRFGIWDLGKRQRRLIPEAPQLSWLMGADVRADGALVATAERQNLVLWRRIPGDVPDFERREKVQHGETDLWGVCFSPDGNHILSYGPPDAVKRWSTRLEHELSYGPVRGFDVVMADVDRTQQNVACVTFSGEGSFLHQWDWTGKPRGPAVHVEETALSVAFSPDGNHLLLGCGDGTVSLRDLEGREIRRYEGPKHSVRCARFSPDGEHVVAGSQDGTVWLWRADGKLIARLPHRAILWWTEFAPDGKSFCSAGTDGTIRIWPMPTDGLDDRAERIYRDLTQAERERYGLAGR